MNESSALPCREHFETTHGHIRLLFQVCWSCTIMWLCRLRKNNQVLHRPRRQLSSGKGNTLVFSSVAIENDDDPFTPGSDGLMFDDTEVENFVNPMAVLVNTSADAGADLASDQPSEIHDWDVDTSTLLHNGGDKKRKNWNQLHLYSKYFMQCWFIITLTLTCTNLCGFWILAFSSSDYRFILSFLQFLLFPFQQALRFRVERYVNK